MKFTPFGIKNQEFNKAVRGYDKEEVRAFLEKLSDEFERMLSEEERLKSELAKMEEQLKEFKKIEKNLQSALLSATESSTKALESAKKQSALMIKEAEVKAAQIIEKAKENADSVRNSVLSLREEKKLLIAKLKAVIESQTNLLDLIAQKKGPKKDLQQKKENTDSIENTEINVDDILERLL
ncbi:DivIVA domain-containing protein [Melioribacteraceae bacterium 4301-Me]|uniref:DivIVA domain-containing protein n=1 Tax=Pyranulibacter aquaticus TaxID=3163344 RepID=UPI003595D607